VTNTTRNILGRSLTWCAGKTIKLREEFAADKHSRISRGLQEDRRNLSEEQRVWRLAQAQKLRGVELRVVQRIWQEQEEQKVRTRIWDEARSEGYVAAHQDMNVENAAKCAQSRQEGLSEGYQTGYRKGQELGRREALTDFRANLDQARAEGLAEANKREAEEVEEIYNRGYAAGISEGDRQGRAKGFEGSEISREETFFGAFHWAVRIIPTWAANDCREVLNHDGTAHLTHAYSWGRRAAKFIRTQGL
jgi:flagellar biosynthesis/type III secretory pathway protein FliH